MITIEQTNSFKEFNPHFIKKNDIKLGFSWVFNKLAGNSEYNLVDSDDPSKNVIVKGSCSSDVPCWSPVNDGKLHENLCYCGKMYNRFKANCICSHAVNTLWTRYSYRLIELENILGGQLARAKKSVMVRIHQSGELESVSELSMWNDLATLNPRHSFGIYTKRVDIIRDFVKNYGGFAPNFAVNISVWGSANMQFAKEFVFMGLGNAFVVNPVAGYLDGTKHTNCPAYRDGKLIHEIPCEKCRKCYRNTNSFIECEQH